MPRSSCGSDRDMYALFHRKEFIVLCVSHDRYERWIEDHAQNINNKQRSLSSTCLSIRVVLLIGNWYLYYAWTLDYPIKYLIDILTASYLYILSFIESIMISVLDKCTLISRHTHVSAMINELAHVTSTQHFWTLIMYRWTDLSLAAAHFVVENFCLRDKLASGTEVQVTPGIRCQDGERKSEPRPLVDTGQYLRCGSAAVLFYRDMTLEERQWRHWIHSADGRESLKR